MAEKVTYLNPAFTKVFEWPSDELMDKRIDFVLEDILNKRILIVDDNAIK